MSLNFVSWKNTALAATLEPNGRHTRQLVYAFLNSANELAILGQDIFFSLRNYGPVWSSSLAGGRRQRDEVKFRYSEKATIFF